MSRGAGGDVCGRSALSYLVGPHGAVVQAGEAPRHGPGQEAFVTPIATPIPTLINNILLYKHFFVDIPSGNITGFASFEATLGGKWLELLTEIAPGLKPIRFT